MAVMQTPTTSVVMTVVIIISNDGDVDAADRERGGNGVDHYQAIWR
jgi:hypothetical protein